jgi:hypothetical protein
MRSLHCFGHRIITVLWAFALVAFCCSCSLFPSISANHAQQEPTGCGALLANNLPSEIIQVDVDTLPIYPEQYFRAALMAIADRVNEHVAIGGSPLIVFVSYITHDSLNRNVMSFTVPGLSTLPAKPVQQTSSDPYKAAQLRKEYQTALSCWQRQVNGLQQEVAHEQGAVKVETTKLRSLPDVFDPVADDIDGALFNASEHLSHYQGVKYLYMASGLQSNTKVNEVRSVNFVGVKVSVVWFACSPASECISTQEQWTNTFRSSGASSVTFTDAGVPSSLQVTF